MGQSKKHRSNRNPVHRRISRWITFWVVGISTFMLIGAPSKEKK